MTKTIINIPTNFQDLSPISAAKKLMKPYLCQSFRFLRISLFFFHFILTELYNEILIGF